MKATQPGNTQFLPVVLTLETQAEVDAMHAILNHDWVVNAETIRSALGVFPYEVLNEYISSKSADMHSNLTAHIRKVSVI